MSLPPPPPNPPPPPGARYAPPPPPPPYPPPPPEDATGMASKSARLIFWPFFFFAGTFAAAPKSGNWSLPSFFCSPNPGKARLALKVSFTGGSSFLELSSSAFRVRV